MNVIIDEAREILNEIIEIRRDIHRHPETALDLPRTSKLVMDKLKEYGVDEVLNPVSTAIIGVIHGGKGPGKCVGLRCDMDALPVKEETGLPYSSENEGKMHACGHDLHASMMLGNAKLLCRHRNDFAGTIKLIFEPGEELQPGGSRMIIESGAVDDVDVFLGMHVLPTENNAGRIELRKGPVTTSSDIARITVHGKAGHGSEPNKAADAILAACQLNLLFQQIPARNVDPLDTVILAVNKIEGGVATNIIAETCHLAASLRTYTKETRELSIAKIHEICRGVEAFSGCTIDDQVALGYDSCYNDPSTVDHLIEAYDEHFGQNFYHMMEEPRKFSEDFSFFSTATGKPAVLLFLDAGHEDGHDKGVLHNEKCTFDEESMQQGMTAMCVGALSLLG